MANNPSSHFKPETDEKTVFSSHEGVVYRIPALIYVGDQKILAFAENRTDSDDTSAVALDMKTGEVNKNESTIKWSEIKPVKEAHLHEHRPMNPCPVYDKTSKTLFLFFICVKGKISESCQRWWGCNKTRLCYIKSNDIGQHWSEVTDLTDKLGDIKHWATFAVGPGHGLQMESGRLIVPLYAYYPPKIFNFSSPHALCIYSDDHGCTIRTDKNPQQAHFDDPGGSVVYRIPALVYIGDHKILAFAENRTGPDDTSTVALDMKTGEVNKNESTIKWSELKPVKEAHLDGYRPMNPCPVYEKTSKTLFLFFICVEGKISERWQIENGCNKTRLCYVKSNDVGKNWSEVTDLTDKLDEIKQWATFAVGPGHGLQMESGRLIVPLYAYYLSDKSPYALCLYSDDQGNTWKLGHKLKKQSGECEMAEVFDDTDNSFIYCNARSKGHRVEAVSEDKGNGFSLLRSTKKLVETKSGCQGSVVSFPAQCEGANTGHNKWLLFIHPTSGHKRVDLGVYLNKSPKDPEAWSKPWIINKGPSGYSDLAYIDDGWFACLMECGEKSEIEQTAFKVFSYNDVIKGGIKK